MMTKLQELQLPIIEQLYRAQYAAATSEENLIAWDTRFTKEPGYPHTLYNVLTDALMESLKLLVGGQARDLYNLMLDNGESVSYNFQYLQKEF